MQYPPDLSSTYDIQRESKAESLMVLQSLCLGKCVVESPRHLRPECTIGQLITANEKQAESDLC